MSTDKPNQDRRSFVRMGLAGGAITAITPNVLAANAITPDEIEGPFYPITPQKDQDFDLTQVTGKDEKALGEVVTIQGQVLDIDGNPVEGATVDIWQANAAGRYRHPHDANPAPLDANFQGWAIVQSGEQGGFKFKTIIPGPYPVSDSWTRPPHIHFKVSKSGYDEVTTQMYFPDHELNQVDRLLQSKTKDEQKMMVAQSVKGDKSNLLYNIVMQAV